MYLYSSHHHNIVAAIAGLVSEWTLEKSFVHGSSEPLAGTCKGLFHTSFDLISLFECCDTNHHTNGRWPPLMRYALVLSLLRHRMPSQDVS